MFSKRWSLETSTIVIIYCFLAACLSSSQLFETRFSGENSQFVTIVPKPTSTNCSPLHCNGRSWSKMDAGGTWQQMYGWGIDLSASRLLDSAGAA